MQFNMSNIVDDVRIRYPYLIIAHNNIISQFDINLGIIISSISNTTVNCRLGIINNSAILMYKDYPNFYTNFSTLLFNNIVKYNNIACLEGYTLNGTNCIKNSTYVYPIIPTVTNVAINTS